MRILLTNHFPLNDLEAGPQMYGLACGLHGAGHEVRALVVDGVATGDEPFPVRRVVCGQQPADLDFDFPRFVAHPRSRQTFDTLTDAQLDHYRNVLRLAMDAEIADFDPHVMHCQHVWLQGHLALEAGVPYVLTAHGDELSRYATDARFQRLMQEAAENAGRIVCVSEAVRRELENVLGDLEGRAVTMPAAVESPATIAWLAALYSEVYIERFGQQPR